MTISIDKILSMGAQDYIGPGNILKNSYNFVGVHYEGSDVEQFAKKVPDNAEVVVDYHHEMAGSFSNGQDNHQYGVALIPKSNTPEKK